MLSPVKEQEITNKSDESGNQDSNIHPVYPVCEGGTYNTSPPAHKGGQNVSSEKNCKKRKISETDDDNLEEEGSADPCFKIKASSFLLTYNNKDEPYDELSLWKLRIFLSQKDCKDLSVCLEVGKNDNYHLHAYVERKTDCSLKFFALDGVTPNCMVNKSRGKAAYASKMRGHYYCGIAPTIGQIKSYSTKIDDDTFDMISAKWATDLCRQNKMTTKNGIKELYKWRNADLYQIKKLENQLSHEKIEESKKLMDNDIKSWRKSFGDFVTIDTVEEWRSKYSKMAGRWDFLILVGPSKCGKSEFARNLFENPYEHKSNISWGLYDDLEHDGIIFHDVKGIFKYIDEERELWQANGIHTVQSTASNMYMKYVNLFRKPMVVVVNRDKVHNIENEWIKANSYRYWVKDGEKLYTEKDFFGRRKSEIEKEEFNINFKDGKLIREKMDIGLIMDY